MDRKQTILLNIRCATVTKLWNSTLSLGWSVSVAYFGFVLCYLELVVIGEYMQVKKLVVESSHAS